MTCTVKICVGKFCLVIIHSNVADFEQTEFAKSIGYDGNVSSMNLAGLSAEPELGSGSPAKDIPSKAEATIDIGASGKFFSKTFQIDYDKSKLAYVWDDAKSVKSWFVESGKEAGNLQNASVTTYLEGFEEFPEIVAFTIKNNGNAIAYVKSE
ncbi:MAG: hypothetical protein ACRESG_03155 [Gammaproteobacteria bacterium]